MSENYINPILIKLEQTYIERELNKPGPGIEYKEPSIEY